MSRDKCLDSLIDGIRHGAALRHALNVQRFETHNAFFKIKDYAIMPQEVATENSALQKSRGLVHWIEVEHRGVDLVSTVSADCEAWQGSRLDVLRNSRRAVNAHVSRLNKLPRFFQRRRLFG